MDPLKLEKNIWRDICSYFGVLPFNISVDKKIREDLGAEDVDIKELIWMIEERYGVQLCAADFDTIPKLVDIILAKKANQDSGGLKMIKELCNKIAVVTGASTGIGRATACLLASRGATVALVGRNKLALEETKRMIEEDAGYAKVYIADLTKEAVNVANNIQNDLGVVDIIVNVAGVWHNEEKAYYGPALWEIPDAELEEVLSVGITAPMLLCKTLLTEMVKRKSGKIVNISGTFENGAAGWLHYYVSKKAIEDFTVGLSQELRKYKIQVNCVCPSDTSTESYKKYYGDYPNECVTPQEIARTVLLLAVDDFDFVNGQVLVVRNKNAGCGE